jgi:hypothetical protein
MKVFVAAVLLAFAVSAAPAGAQSAPGPSAAVVHHSTYAGARPQPAFFRSHSYLRRKGLVESKSNPGPSFVSTRKLQYQGGPILTSTNVHLIFWSGPFFDCSLPNNGDLIMKRYLSQASGKGLFKVLHQYFMINTDGTKTYPTAQVNYAGTFSDCVTPYPHHCTHPITGANCILRSDAEEEVKRAIIQEDWSYGLATNDVFMLFTGSVSGGGTVVGVCFKVDAGGNCKDGEASGRDWCAYHSWFPYDLGGTDVPVIYSTTPYPLGAPDGGPGCSFTPWAPHGPGLFDAMLHLTNHEHMEMITDPLPGIGTYGWIDRKETGREGGEVADKCAWEFYPLKSVNIGGQTVFYNQKWGPLKPTFPGSLYVLQNEFSNKALKAGSPPCVQGHA